ncbi:LysR family transcriptional regulator [Microbacterium lacus]|uniref:LysR family transcriptional regulator n=1 Tax=Microbacterium lacus TaxID=415217 RepID=UPI00384EF4D9
MNRVHSPTSRRNASRRPHHLTSFSQLQAFATAAELGSFTRAAAALSITQPAISELIRRLEHDLETTLIGRRGGKFALTMAGEKMLPHAKQAVAAARRAIEAVRNEAPSNNFL